MLDGTDIVKEMQPAGARHEAAGVNPESELSLVVEKEVGGGSEWEEWSVEDWIAGTGANLGETTAGNKTGGESVVQWSTLLMSPGGWWWTAAQWRILEGQWSWGWHSRPLMVLWRWMDGALGDG